jgi:hypothetical protein
MSRRGGARDGHARSQPRHAAGFAVLPPNFSVDMPVAVERCDEDIRDIVGALGMSVLARELDPDLAKARR